MAFKKGNTINLGRKIPDEVRHKMSEAHKRRILNGGKKPSSWGAGFTRGHNPWNSRASVSRNAYYAGLVDGEAHISIQDNCQRSIDPEKRYKRLAVRITMVDALEVLEEGQKLWGGWIKKRERSKENPNYHDSHEWVLQHGYASRFLISILPYLRLKRKQAEIALKYRWLQKRGRPGSIRGEISIEELEYRKKLVIELKSLHLKKGKQSS